LFQEAESKAKPTVPGKKTAETRILKPEDQKKLEGSDRNYAAAVKKEEQRNQRASSVREATARWEGCLSRGLWGPQVPVLLSESSLRSQGQHGSVELGRGPNSPDSYLT
jgi:hypothetical protein